MVNNDVNPKLHNSTTKVMETRMKSPKCRHKDRVDGYLLLYIERSLSLYIRDIGTRKQV